MGDYSSIFPQEKIKMTLSQLVEKVKSQIHYVLLESDFNPDPLEVEKVCETFKDVFPSFLIENKMQYVGSCQAKLVVKKVGHIFHFIWSRVDLRDDLIRLDLSLGYSGENGFEKIGESLIKLTFHERSLIATDSRFNENIKVKLSPIYDLSRWIFRYGAYYTYLVLIYRELSRKFIDEEEFGNIIQKFIKYSEVVKSVERTLKLRVYPDEDSLEGRFRARFISNLCTCFSQYKINNNARAILFYGNTREKVSLFKKCRGKVDKIIVLKNSLIVRYGVSSSNESTMKLERLLFTDFKILSKQDFKKIMFVLVLEGRWSTITGWDLGLEF